MKTAQYIKTLFCMLWNMIVFLFPNISQHNDEERKKFVFSYIQLVNKYFSARLYNFKRFIIYIDLKIKNNSTARLPAASNYINKNKHSKLNRVISNVTTINQEFKSLNSFCIKRLKDALATQNLISKLKQHFILPGAMVVVYQSLLIQLDLSCIKACSDDLKKVMTIIQDKCAFLYPFVSKNYHCINCL